MDTSLALLGSPWIIVAVFVIVFVAAIVQVGLGMGFGLTAAPLLALFNPELVPVPTLILGLLTALWGAWRERSSIAWSEVGLGVAGRAVGVAAGTVILFNLTDRKSFMLVFGAMIGLATILSLSGRRIAFSPKSVGAMSSLSGLMGTITSVGAPPMALIYQDRPAAIARPTLAAFFAFGCTFSLIGLHVAGWTDRQDILVAVLMLPPLFAGMFVARLLHGRFDARYRPALLFVSGLAATILIIRGLN